MVVVKHTGLNHEESSALLLFPFSLSPESSFNITTILYLSFYFYILPTKD